MCLKMSTPPLKTLNFEVFGKVQGVFFRKYTQLQAKKLGLNGWVQNTDSGTVVGCLEGPEDKVKQMKKWLEETGSPESRIEKCVFTNERSVDKISYSTFRKHGFKKLGVQRVRLTNVYLRRKDALVLKLSQVS